MSDARREIAADTSFLINLFATQIATELLDAERLCFLVPTAVYGEIRRNRAELDVFIANGYARVIELPDAALQHYVDAAATVDDGEAATIALGIALQIGIATDDGCAADYWVEATRGDGQKVLGICDLLKAVQPKLGIDILRTVLVRIRRDANFASPRQHADWWSSVLSVGR